MKLAWFRPDDPLLPPALDDSAALVTQLRSTHEIDVFTASNASAFAALHARAAYDLSVFELDDTPAHAFLWPFLLHYGGVLQLRTLTLHTSRAGELLRAERAGDYAAEFAFNHGPWPEELPAAPPAYPGDWPMLRVPALAARIVVVSQPSTAEQLRRAHPDARVRVAQTGIVAATNSPASHDEVPAASASPETPVTFGVMSGGRLDVVRRAIARVRDAGAQAALMEARPERLLEEADVLIALHWPPHGEPQTPALAAMAAGKPVIVFESASSARWPALDPQTWQPRGRTTDAPIAVSVDPRDEEHSLVLAIRRLSAEAALRGRLGLAARDWWRAHATPQHAALDWQRILEEAALLPPLAHPADWPAHLTQGEFAGDRESL
ncbi:MAG: hypothetical protein O2930_09025 [Acidobacteria bacterium]|nr:hypothetical protein [Acidobacteriota bacterium]